MDTILDITTVNVASENDAANAFDMTGRCAFAICVEGDFDIRILNEEYRAEDHCIIACMPFVKIEILRVRKSGRIILGGIKLEDVLSLISRTINNTNLLAIQQTPLVRISEQQCAYLQESIGSFLNDLADSHKENLSVNCNTLQNEIVHCHSQLIVAQVLKVYLTNAPMDVKGHTRRDIVFQHFMLDLYKHCREQRDVQFYAARSAVSLKYFSTIVRQLSGSSPSEWIETVVAGEAKSLLNESQRSIKDIAATLNFPDAPTFTKYFRRVTGITPKAYRRSLV